MLRFLKIYIPFTWISLLIITLSITLAYRLEGNGIQSVVSENVELAQEVKDLETKIQELLIERALSLQVKD